MHSGLFDYIVGFTAPGVSPQMVMSPVNVAIKSIHCSGRDPRQAFEDAFTANPDGLSHSPIVIVTRVDSPASTSHAWHATQLVYSRPASHPWGYIPQCPSCKGKGHVTVATNRKKLPKQIENHGEIQLTCNQCNTRKPYFHRPKFVVPIDRSPFFFKIKWPLSEVELGMILGHVGVDGEFVKSWPPRPPADAAGSGRAKRKVYPMGRR